MGHDHSHLPPQSASGRHLSRLAMALTISAAFMFIEFAFAVLTNSLVLISDATHMLTDVLGLSMALSAVLLARRKAPTYARTFGYYRAEVLAALVNAVLLFAVAIYVVTEALMRIGDPPQVDAKPVLVVGCIGLVANMASAMLLRSGSHESLNMKAAYLEVIADLVGTVGVLVSATITLFTGWRYADIIIGVAVGVWVLPRTFTIARRTLRILFQHSPEGVDVEGIATALKALPGVADLHDLHIWTLTSGMEVASVHLIVAEGADADVVLALAQDVLTHDHHIPHATLQVEGADAARRCAELSW
ncbi:MAG: cation diffusion facilitator family transporter [Nocardiaceae bacterium]|nr:cation diffusion facilitator family transporter [Nocardiaceae bacterium]